MHLQCTHIYKNWFNKIVYMDYTVYTDYSCSIGLVRHRYVSETDLLQSIMICVGLHSNIYLVLCLTFYFCKRQA